MESEIKKGIIYANEIPEDSTFVFFISKNEIELCSTYRLEEQIKELKKAGKKGKNSLLLSYMGYDNDPREVFMIPEIITYFRKVFSKYPEVFYFLEIEGYTLPMHINMTFQHKDEVKKADEAILKQAKENGDTDRAITVSYYASHQKEFH